MIIIDLSDFRKIPVNSSRISWILEKEIFNQMSQNSRIPEGILFRNSPNACILLNNNNQFCWHYHIMVKCNLMWKILWICYLVTFYGRRNRSMKSWSPCYIKTFDQNLWGIEFIISCFLSEKKAWDLVRTKKLNFLTNIATKTHQE